MWLIRNWEMYQYTFFRKATLKNSERFGTEELARIGEICWSAWEVSQPRVRNLYAHPWGSQQVYPALAGSSPRNCNGWCLAKSGGCGWNPAFDPTWVWGWFTNRYPKGRHAVVEKVMGAQTYIPNSIQMAEDTSIQLITGPNMSGKSTYMRQPAMTAIMAQLGSYSAGRKRPFAYLRCYLYPYWAADDLVSGQSTFMVEMMEANNAISHATKNSLILFDELGRGTATYDGMALAQSIIEYIHEHIGPKPSLLPTTMSWPVWSPAKNLVNVHVATFGAGWAGYLPS